MHEGACSGYADGPLACREHAPFYTNAAACQTSVMNEVLVSRARFSGLEKALFKISVERGVLVVPDIRDFFPAQRA
jgi:hypothetical protein